MARKAWNRLRSAGLDAAARQCLWGYYAGNYVITESVNHSRLAARNLTALDRAARVAEERTDDPRAEMFLRRFELARRTAAQSPWPYYNPFQKRSIKTLEEAARHGSVVGIVPPKKASTALLKASDNLRRYGGKIHLTVLRAGARAFGVDLSLTQLVALAHCADPDRALDERSLRRFFGMPICRQGESNDAALFVHMVTNLRRSS